MPISGVYNTDHIEIGATCIGFRNSACCNDLSSISMVREDSPALQYICYLDGAARGALQCVVHVCRVLL
jgi:hypothetical protein